MMNLQYIKEDAVLEFIDKMDVLHPIFGTT